MNLIGKKIMNNQKKYLDLTHITTKVAANKHLAMLVNIHSQEYPNRPLELIQKMERYNIGYYTGHLSYTDAKRIERLFNCYHPIFGPKEIDFDHEEIFNLGAITMQTHDITSEQFQELLETYQDAIHNDYESFSVSFVEPVILTKYTKYWIEYLKLSRELQNTD